MPRAAMPADATPRIAIRVLDAADAPALKACRVAGMRAAPDAFLSTADAVERTPLSRFEAELADPDIHYVGAFDDIALIGFMRYVRDARQARRHVAEVRSVLVAAAYRRRGIARRLLSRLVDDAAAAGIESLILTVVDGNAAALALYASTGFAVYGREPRAIRKGGSDHDHDQLYLQLQLPMPRRDRRFPADDAPRRPGADG